jgi:hypothetical protein
MEVEKGYLGSDMHLDTLSLWKFANGAPRSAKYAWQNLNSDDTSCIKQIPRISMRMFTITSICHLFLNYHLSYSLGSDLTKFGLVSSHDYFWKTT